MLRLPRHAAVKEAGLEPAFYAAGGFRLQDEPVVERLDAEINGRRLKRVS